MQVFVSGSVWCDVMHKIYHPYILPDVKIKHTVKNASPHNGAERRRITDSPGYICTHYWGRARLTFESHRGRVSGLGPHQ